MTHFGMGRREEPGMKVLAADRLEQESIGSGRCGIE